MKLGLLSASLETMSTEAVIARAASIGLDAVELAAWPQPLERPFTADHVLSESPARLRDMLDRHGVAVAALAYYDNPLDPDEAKRVQVRVHLERLIDLAAEIACPL